MIATGDTEVKKQKEKQMWPHALMILKDFWGRLFIHHEKRMVLEENLQKVGAHLLLFFCITNYHETQYLKATMIIISQFLGARNFGAALLSCSVSGSHKISVRCKLDCHFLKVKEGCKICFQVLTHGCWWEASASVTRILEWPHGMVLVSLWTHSN